MPPPSRRDAVATWDGRAIHVWVWDGDRGLSVAALYRAFRPPWPTTPMALGTPSMVSVLPRRGRPLLTPSVSMTPRLAARWFAESPEWVPAAAAVQATDSVRWFGRLGRLADELVEAGRVRPVLERRRASDTWITRWAPVPDAATEALLAGFAASMPPVARAEPARPSDEPPDPQTATSEILHAFVDGIARTALHLGDWTPDDGDDRSHVARARRAVFGALAHPEPAVRQLGAAPTAEVARLADELDAMLRRARGEPVVRARVRLELPDDVDLPWRVELDIVDEADAGRWCSADDVWDRSDLAVEVAGDPRHVEVLRDVLGDAARRIGKVVPQLADWAVAHEPTSVELDLEEAEDFLVEGPAALESERIELVGPERLVKAHVGVRGRVSAGPSDRPGGFTKEAIVAWSASISADGETTALSDAELLRAEAAGSTLLRSGRRWVRIDPQALRKARQRLDDERADHGVVDPLTLLSLTADPDTEIDAELEVETATPAVGDGILGTSVGEQYQPGTLRSWAAELVAGLVDARLTEAPEPDGFVGTLRPYQRRGLGWLSFLAELGLGGCLADDMGLGKTATTLAHLLGRPGPHLVVCPLSVVHNWEAEARRFAPALRTLVHHGSTRQRPLDDSQVRLDGIVDEATADLVITTYGLLARDLDHLAATEWSTLVLDEAQMIKNPATNAARAVRKLTAGQKLALTGTPVENRLADLWALLDAVNPGMLGSREKFRHRFAKPIERDGDADAAAQLRTLTQPFVLRRTKADRTLVPDLPDKIEQTAYATLTKEQAVLYQHVVSQLLDDAEQSEGMARRGLVLQALTRLKQICNHPVHVLGDGSRLAGRSGKLARFDELVDELLDVDERALVFTQFRQMGELLRRHLFERLGLSVPFLHGGVAKSQRDQMVASFQAGQGAPLLLVSLKAGGTGLNLTAASQVIHYDRWWNPAVEDQATDRAWRIGQGRTVLVHKLVCEGTIEERVAALIDDKRALAESVVGTGESWLTELSTADLRALVELDGRAAGREGDRG